MNYLNKSKIKLSNVSSIFRFEIALETLHYFFFPLVIFQLHTSNEPSKYVYINRDKKEQSTCSPQRTKFCFSLSY